MVGIRLWQRGGVGLMVWVLLLLLFSTQPAQGQDGGKGLSLGLEARWLRHSDELVSPLRYSGIAWGPTLRYGFSTPSRLRDFSFSLGLPVLSSSQTGGGAHRQEGYRLDLSLGSFYQVAQSESGALAFLLGGEVRGEFALYDHWYTSVASESWMHLFALVQPGGIWRLRLPGGHDLVQKITVPLGGLVMRPGYQGMTETPHVEWEGIGRVRGVYQSLQLMRPLGAHGRWGVSYDLSVLRYPDPRPLATVRHALRVHATVWGGGS